MTSPPTGSFEVLQDAETVSGRVAGAILTRSLIAVDLIPDGEVRFRVRATNHENDSSTSLIEGMTTPGDRHITLHLYPDGRVSARIVSLP